ncbi:MAG: hypothetical protein ACLT5P_08815 [Flavonifractor plautii]
MARSSSWLGFNMDEGQLVKWHRQVGETVKKGEVLFGSAPA